VPSAFEPLYMTTAMVSTLKAPVSRKRAIRSGDMPALSRSSAEVARHNFQGQGGPGRKGGPVTLITSCEVPVPIYGPVEVDPVAFHLSETSHRNTQYVRLARSDVCAGPHSTRGKLGFPFANRFRDKHNTALQDHFR